jgi:hypothetical protein
VVALIEVPVITALMGRIITGAVAQVTMDATARVAEARTGAGLANEQTKHGRIRKQGFIML